MVQPGHSRTGSGEAKVAHIVHHDQYYLRGGDVTFLVENYLFRVHRYFFERESPFFYAKLVTPASPGQTPVGTSDSNAFALDSVTPEEFARFLWVFYNPRYSLYDTTDEEWFAILRLAHEWQFAEVKNLAVRELEKKPIGHIRKIVHYHKFDVDRRYLIPSYAAIVAREDPISLEEGMQLGLETSLMIAKARECARGKQAENGARSPTSASLPDTDMKSIVHDVFKIIDPPNTPTSPKGEQAPSVNGQHANGTNGAAASSTISNGPKSPHANGGQANGGQANGGQPSSPSLNAVKSPTAGNGSQPMQPILDLIDVSSGPAQGSTLAATPVSGKAGGNDAETEDDAASTGPGRQGARKNKGGRGPR